MTDMIILHSPQHELLLMPSSSSSNDVFLQQTATFANHDEALINTSSSANDDGNSIPVALYRRRCTSSRQIQEDQEEEDQLSVLAVFLTVFRKSLVGCSRSVEESRSCGGVEESSKKRLMEIGWPTNVRHVAHVTFDRFNGFLGLPVEFEPEVPRRPPSASTRVFGVSTESMQLSFDSRGNCVPTILLMMQRRLYLQGGLQSEGIFRINPENGQEEFVREQLNNGVIPENIDVHCLAGLIKAWFRELPNGILDSLPPEQVMEAQSEEECARIVKLLPPIESALLDWAINLMADVAQFENYNKMNARNIAMVFAPNMTQMSDPLTALMFAVQVMNFLKMLIVRTLREREDCLVEGGEKLQLDPSDEEDGRHSTLKPSLNLEANDEEVADYSAKEPLSNSNNISSSASDETLLSSIENILPDGKEELVADHNSVLNSHLIGRAQARSRRTKAGQPGTNRNDASKGSRKVYAPTSVAAVGADVAADKKKESDIINRVSSHAAERVEVWR